MAIEGSGRTRELGERFGKPLANTTKLDDSGYVLKSIVQNSTNKVDICGRNDYPYCVNDRSTRDAFSIDHPNTSFLTGNSDRLPTIDCSDTAEHALKIANNNAPIAVGDPLAVAISGGGKVDKYTPTAVGATYSSAAILARFRELGKIVGYAQEAIPAGSTGAPGKDKVRTRITIKLVPVVA